VKVVESANATAVDIFANALPVASPVGPMVVDNRISDVANDKGHIADALDRAKILTVGKHAAWTEFSTSSKLAIRCERIADFINLTDRVTELRAILACTIGCGAQSAIFYPSE
jgi:hypothetical protein